MLGFRLSASELRVGTACVPVLEGFPIRMHTHTHTTVLNQTILHAAMVRELVRNCKDSKAERREE